TSAELFLPTTCTCDQSGNLYFALPYDYVIRKVDIATTQVTTLAGSLGDAGYLDGTGADALFTFPQGLAWDPVGGLYVADTQSCTLRQVDTSTGQVTTIGGSQGNCAEMDG